MTGTQQPIFQKRPDLLAKALAGSERPARARRVMPQCVFAAGRDRFECIVTGEDTVMEAEIAIMLELPLDEHGWDMKRIKFTHLSTDHGDMTFLVEKG
jgi:hypothetical protein